MITKFVRYASVFIMLVFMLTALQAEAKPKVVTSPEERAAQMREMMQRQSMQKFVQQGSYSKGKRIFNDPKLGTNGKSCASCHFDEGEKIMRHKEFNLHLAAVVQYCYQNALQGKGVIAKDKLDDLLSFFLSKVKNKKKTTGTIRERKKQQVVKELYK